MSNSGISQLVKDTKSAHDRLRLRGLERHIAELDILGYTVVEPDLLGMTDLVPETRDLMISIAQEDGAAEVEFKTYLEGLSYELYALYRQGRPFEQWIVNPTILEIGKYLLGENMTLNNNLGYVKGKSDQHLRIHVDTLMVPDPLPEYRHLINMTIALTDYTLSGGCIGIVPGSHKLRRHPTADEAHLYDLMTPVECPAGSLVVIPGNTWHGAFPKETDGLRVTLVQGYSRRYLAPYVSLEADEAILKRNPPEFARLLGSESWLGFGEKGVDTALMGPSYISSRSQLS
jgi:ectoine hydroxylase-related dioxygenase (phytanoyl-CoA dioxygenase family)